MSIFITAVLKPFSPLSDNGNNYLNSADNLSSPIFTNGPVVAMLRRMLLSVLYFEHSYPFFFQFIQDIRRDMVGDRLAKRLD